MKLAPLDWKLLNEMSDEKRYTQGYLANDVESFSEDSHDYIRQRVGALHAFGLVRKVGTSQMYEITELGHAALALQAEYREADLEPIEFAQKVRSRAADS